MKAIVLKLQEIQSVLDQLKDLEAVNYSYKSKKERDSLTVAVHEEKIPKELQKRIIDADLDEKDFTPDFKESLSEILSDEELTLVKTAYDVIGTIAVLEIDTILSHKSIAIAETLLRSNPVIKTVVQKGGAHKGTLRIQDYTYLAGEKTFETIHKENGCVLKIILNKVYYSPRSATERKRVFSQVKPGERVLVMFSGCGPFVCTVSKNTAAKHVVGIELNDVGHDLAVENMKLNKLKNVDLIQGDVRDICPELAKKGITFDRIIMPLPKTAEEFLPEAFMVAKERTIIHLYDFVDEREFPQITIDKIEQHTKDISYNILDAVKAGQFAPYIFRVCVDFSISKKQF